MTPNFLIAGTPKAGTTSLYHYLWQHPEVFLSTPKEPHFFSSQCIKLPVKDYKGPSNAIRFVHNQDAYLNLFEEAAGFKAIGEASTDTFYYSESIEHIKSCLGNPKIILLFRNPVDRLISQFRHQKRENMEPLTLEEALREEGNRIRENYAVGYHYSSLGFYAERLKQFQKAFSHVHIIFFEDLKNNPEEVMQEVFRFLEINPSFSPDLSTVFNPAGKPKIKWIHDFFYSKSRIRDLLRPVFSIFLSPEKRFRIMEDIKNKNLKKDSIEIADETKHSLITLYKNDILRLQDLTHRDLSSWLK